MRRRLDLAGSRFGRLTVLHRVEGTTRSAWLCRCDCGTLRTVRGSDLRSGNTTSCGCRQREGFAARSSALNRARSPLAPGQRYGRLVVLARDSRETSRGRYWRWRCRCDCGREILVRGVNLTTGNTRSCGAPECRRALRASRRSATAHREAGPDD